jgi:hypothetical protein
VGIRTNTTLTSVTHLYQLPSTNAVILIVSNSTGAATNAKPAHITVVVYPPGDVNGNSTVTDADSLLINQALVGLRSTNDPIFQTTGFESGDVNQSNFVSGADSLLINQGIVGLRPYIVTKILPASHSSNQTTGVRIYGIGFPMNEVPIASFGSPVNLTLTGVAVSNREQITATVPAGGGVGTGTVNVIYNTTNGTISFGKFINQ